MVDNNRREIRTMRREGVVCEAVIKYIAEDETDAGTALHEITCKCGTVYTEPAYNNVDIRTKCPNCFTPVVLKGWNEW